MFDVYIEYMGHNVNTHKTWIIFKLNDLLVETFIGVRNNLKLGRIWLKYVF